MKRCPECDSTFPDTEKFCELDGAPLVADDSDSDPDSLVPPADESPEPDVEAEELEADEYEYSRENPPEQNWKALAIVAVAGVALGIVVFIVYHRLTREAPVQSSNTSSNEAVVQQQIPLAPSDPSLFADTSPSTEPSPSPSPSARPTPAAPAVSPGVVLSSSPVSTGGSTRRGPVTIRLTDGTSIEAEEVWETGEGIWYRRRGLVTLLKRNQVKAIDQPRTTPPSPAPTTAASPSASP